MLSGESKSSSSELDELFAVVDDIRKKVDFYLSSKYASSNDVIFKSKM